jgi:hypothetical protein
METTTEVQPVVEKRIRPRPITDAEPSFLVVETKLSDTEKVRRIRDALDEVRLGLTAGEGQGFLFAAQAQINTYLQIYSK